MKFSVEWARVRDGERDGDGKIMLNSDALMLVNPYGFSTANFVHYISPKRQNITCIYGNGSASHSVISDGLLLLQFQTRKLAATVQIAVNPIQPFLRFCKKIRSRFRWEIPLITLITSIKSGLFRSLVSFQFSLSLSLFSATDCWIRLLSFLN